MVGKRKQSKAQMRNLAQYKDMTEEDFENLWEEKVDSLRSSQDFEERIQKKIQDFGKDYDIDDLKINDKETLRALMMALISLEDYEQIVYELRTEIGVNQSNVTIVDRLNKTMSDLRRDISKLQEDLNISRRIRKTDKESSVVSYIAGLKEQARQFYESRASFVFCPKCDMMLGTIWVLYPYESNKFTFTCHRELDDGSFCEEKFSVTSKELLDNGGTNKPEVTPEGLI